MMDVPPQDRSIGIQRPTTDLLFASEERIIKRQSAHGKCSISEEVFRSYKSGSNAGYSNYTISTFMFATTN
jgi:hypothetical protein